MQCILQAESSPPEKNYPPSEINAFKFVPKKLSGAQSLSCHSVQLISIPRYVARDSSIQIESLK